MVKRRNDKRNPCIIGGEKTPANNRFSAFEFTDDDLFVETGSRKILAKFRTKSPNKKPAVTQSLDKYAFLQLFAKGPIAQQIKSGTETVDIDFSDIVLEDRTSRPDVPVSASPSRNLLAAALNPHNVKGSSCRVQSCAYRSREAGDCKTKKKHNNVYCLDSDEDVEVEFHTSTSSPDITESKSSLEEQSPQNGSHANDCEAVVVVSPMYIKYGKMYYTKCSLTFSSRYVILEGPPLCERKIPHRLQWSTFDIEKIEYQPYESGQADVVNLHIKCRDSDVDVFCTRNSGIIELEFVVHDDPHWSRKREEIKSLNLKYEAVWKNIISDSSLIEHFDDIVYPEGDADAVSISQSDIERLRPRTFINDTLIDFYIKYLLNKTKPEERQRFHFFNTFFFRKLADMDWGSPSTWEGDAFRRVRKWTRNINLFGKDFIFIPVNLSLHWSLIVVCHPGEVANSRENVDESCKKPCILHMDSLRGSHRGFENFIRRYLWEEWKACNNKHNEDILKKFYNLNFEALQLPQQENLFDCGLFLLHYAELFLAQAANFSTARYSSLLTQDWFLPAEVSLKKRDHIRKLILKIIGDNASKDPPPACEDRYLPSDVNGGDSDVKVMWESNVKETHSGIKFKSDIDHEMKGQQSSQDMFKPKNTDRSVNDERSLLCEQFSIDQRSSRRLPMEKEAGEKQATSSPVATTRHQDDEYENTTPLYYSPSSFRVGEIEVPIGTSDICVGTPQRSIAVHNNEGHVPEVTPQRSIAVHNNEGHVPEVTSAEEKCEYSSMSMEDLADCIVEDSEEESGEERTKKTIRSFPSPRKISIIFELDD